MVHAALLLLMLEAVPGDLVFTISLKRSTPNLQLSTSRRPITPSYRSANACATVFVGMVPEGLRSRPGAFEFFVLLRTHANEPTVAGFHTLSHSNADKQSSSQRRTKSRLDVRSIGHHRG